MTFSSLAENNNRELCMRTKQEAHPNRNQQAQVQWNWIVHTMGQPASALSWQALEKTEPTVRAIKEGGKQASELGGERAGQQNIYRAHCIVLLMLFVPNGS